MESKDKQDHIQTNKDEHENIRRSQSDQEEHEKDSQSLLSQPARQRRSDLNQIQEQQPILRPSVLNHIQEQQPTQRRSDLNHIQEQLSTQRRSDLNHIQEQQPTQRRSDLNIQEQQLRQRRTTPLSSLSDTRSSGNDEQEDDSCCYKCFKWCLGIAPQTRSSDSYSKPAEINQRVENNNGNKSKATTRIFGTDLYSQEKQNRTCLQGFNSFIDHLFPFRCSKRNNQPITKSYDFILTEFLALPSTEPDPPENNLEENGIPEELDESRCCLSEFCRSPSKQIMIEQSKAKKNQNKGRRRTQDNEGLIQGVLTKNLLSRFLNSMHDDPEVNDLCERFSNMQIKD